MRFGVCQSGYQGTITRVLSLWLLLDGLMSLHEARLLRGVSVPGGWLRRVTYLPKWGERHKISWLLLGNSQ